MFFKKWVLLILILLFTTSVFSTETVKLTLLKNGKAHRVVDLETLKSLQKDENLKVFEPHENRQKEYRGFSLIPLVETIYGKSLSPSLDTLVFYCNDGYRSDVPLVEFKKKKATLSFAMSDGSSFVLKKATQVPLGPFYLTWDHPNAASAKKEFFRWPYGIDKIDLIDSSKAYEPLLPPEKSADFIKRGHQEFLKHCFSCHALNGVGGLRGPPLNYFVKIHTTQDLEKYILDPQSVNKNSVMNGLPLTLQDREQVAKDIVSYLKKLNVP